MNIAVDLLNKAEAASVARIKPSTLDRLVRDGSGPIVTKIGGRILFRREDVAEWINNQRVIPHS